MQKLVPFLGLTVLVISTASRQDPVDIRDLSKLLVEQPLKDAIHPPPAPDRPFSTGMVDWHPSFDEACEAAVESGKPVLLFQLFGRLDEEFC